MLGITIGVFSIVGVMTALSAVKGAIDSGLNILGAGVFMIVKNAPVTFEGDNAGWRNRPDITYRQALRFKELMSDSPAKVSLRRETGGLKARYGEAETRRLQVVGTSEHYIEMENFKLAYGRPLVAEDVAFARPVAVVGQDVEEDLFPHSSPLGKWISVGRNRYRVVGVLEEKGDLFGGSQDNRLLIPITRLFIDYGGRWGSTSIAVQAPSQEAMPDVVEQAVGAMRTARRLAPEDRNDFEMLANSSLLRAFDKVAVVIGTGGLIISSIALVAAGVGIMNIMLVSVTERTREIGVLKAIGARRGDILKQFLLEAVLLSEVGGAVGILLGVAAGNALAYKMEVNLIFPWFWAGAAVLVCSLIGITFGLYPAWKAGRLNPVEALRFE